MVSILQNFYIHNFASVQMQQYNLRLFPLIQDQWFFGQVTIILPFSVMFVTIVQGSVSQLLNQSFCQPVRHPIAQSVSQLLNQSFCQPVRYPIAQSVSQFLHQSVSGTVSCSFSQSFSQLYNQSFHQPVSQLQVDSQPVSKLFSQSVKMVS